MLWAVGGDTIQQSSQWIDHAKLPWLASSPLALSTDWLKINHKILEINRKKLIKIRLRFQNEILKPYYFLIINRLRDVSIYINNTKSL